MKTRAILLTLSFFVLFSCTKENESINSEGTTLVFSAVAAGEESKTVLQKDGVSLWWSPGDQINLFYGNESSSKFTAQISEAAKLANFVGNLNVVIGTIESGSSEKEFWGVYPYSPSRVCDNNSVTISIPSEQQSSADVFPTALFPSVAKSTSLHLAFYNVCGGLKFSVSHNDVKSVTFIAKGGQTIAGDVKVGFNEEGKPAVNQVISGQSIITIMPDEGQYFQPGKNYYAVMLPGILTEGYSIVISRDNTIGVKDNSELISIVRSRFGVLSQLDKNLAFGKYYVDEYGVNQGLGVEIDGVIWAPVNCGYKSPSADSKGFPYGKLYQWGRRTGFGWPGMDESSPIYRSMWTGKNGEESENVFYIGGTGSKYKNDWIKDGDEKFWNGGTDEHPVKTEFDPCPEGWRVPTKEEIDGLNNGDWSYATIDGINGRWFSGSNAFSESLLSKIFLPAAGAYDYDGNMDISRGSKAFYWSSYKQYHLYFHDDWYKKTQYGSPGDAKSVRCVSIDSHHAPVIDLSSNGTANSYIVPAAGSYKFIATVKGNSNEPVGTPVAAEVLWESFGTATSPKVGDIIKSVSLINGYVQFETPETLANGNVVIAVKDASGTILWSWHIWVCGGFDPVATQQVYANNAGTMMDRNLGATSATPGDVKALGLLYQWGRKDPFLNSSSISYSVRAASTITWPSVVKSSSITGTVSYTISHPTTHISENSYNRNWYYSGSVSSDSSLWKAEKTIYDPCPQGWKVPEGGSNGIWSTAFGTDKIFSDFTWDNMNKGMQFGNAATRKLGYYDSIWYPATGGVDEYGHFDRIGYSGGYFSSTAHDNFSYAIGFIAAENKCGGSERNCMSDARSVRCCKEN